MFSRVPRFPTHFLGDGLNTVFGEYGLQTPSSVSFLALAVLLSEL